MNSIKNAIVTMTMLAVGYGTYVVLSSPAPEEGAEEMAGADPWAVPEVSTGDEVEVADGTPADLQAPTEPADGAPDLAAAEPVASDDVEVSVPDSPGDATNSDAPADSSSDYPVTDAPEWSLNGPNNAVRVADEAESPSNSDLTTAGADNNESSPAEAEGSATDGATALASSQSSDAAATDRVGDPGSPFETAWSEVQKLLQERQLGEALLTLSAWYGDESLSSEQVDRCVKLLDELAGTVIYSPESYLEPAYKVRTGDTFESLAEEFSVSADFLARINGLSVDDTLRTGTELKVVRGPFRAEVDRAQSIITIFLGRHYAGRFPVRVGADLPDGDASYEVASVEEGREFFDRRSGFRVKANDPKNPYGGRWIGLRGDQITAAHNVGIHADAGDESTGCLAVSATDAEDLAAILSVGARIQVKN